MVKRKTVAKKTTATADVVCADVVGVGEEGFLPCKLMEFRDPDERYAAAELAWEEEPRNEPHMTHVQSLVDTGVDERQALALLTSKWWGSKGVKLGVYFDTSNQALKNKILSFFNLWNGGGRANILFQEASVGMAQARVSFDPRDGYWSYLGTDNLKIRSGPTMNLAGFTTSTPDAVYHRVGCHECGHLIGCPHEHLREEIVKNIIVEAALELFRRQQGWDERTTRSNVLTPLEKHTLYGIPPLEQTSIMAYSLPGSIMRDGKPVLGGSRITDTDLDYIITCYPVSTPPPPPPPPPPTGTWTVRIPGGAVISGTGAPPVVQQSGLEV